MNVDDERILQSAERAFDERKYEQGPSVVYTSRRGWNRYGAMLFGAYNWLNMKRRRFGRGTLRRKHGGRMVRVRR